MQDTTLCNCGLEKRALLQEFCYPLGKILDSAIVGDIHCYSLLMNLWIFNLRTRPKFASDPFYISKANTNVSFFYTKAQSWLVSTTTITNYAKVTFWVSTNICKTRHTVVVKTKCSTEVKKEEASLIIVFNDRLISKSSESQPMNRILRGGAAQPLGGNSVMVSCATSADHDSPINLLSLEATKKVKECWEENQSFSCL